MNNYFSPNQQARLSQLENQYSGQLPLNFSQHSPKNLNVQYDLISGYEEAKIYSIAPGKVALLFDNQQNEFYMKTVDSIGMQTLKKFTYQEVPLPTSGTPGISPEANINKRLDSLETAINQLLKQNNKEETK